MSIEQIKALPVSDLAADDCALFMWITFPCLYEALEVIEAWGFSYKTLAFVWVKQNRKSESLFWGMGYWTRANAELCILATKGHPKRQSSSVHQVIMSHVQEHSRKPEETRTRIVQLMGDLPRIELFARQSPEGWAVWGNEVNSTISLNRKEDYDGICSGPEGSNQSKNEGRVQPDQTTTDLLLSGDSGRYSNVSAD
jgi:N6-adenosine-specific RNA methylase IME4